MKVKKTIKRRRRQRDEQHAVRVKPTVDPNWRGVMHELIRPRLTITVAEFRDGPVMVDSVWCWDIRWGGKILGRGETFSEKSAKLAAQDKADDLVFREAMTKL